ncbi:hypothetical protein VTJ83DRAFT_6027 [Remersonia thermophila]|uniref:Uncharacterized protein n=1 Tax=Remersonia thermophila TaxID=72144 RepID=A0ABR4D8N0_9PEZI
MSRAPSRNVGCRMTYREIRRHGAAAVLDGNTAAVLVRHIGPSRAEVL